MQKKNLATVGASALVVAGLAAGVLAAPASADIAPKASDATAVGSDTVQYVVDFLADGNGARTGYNFSNPNRVFSFDATGDASGRAAYQNGKTTTLASTVVLRAGQKPTTRPNGSGAGLSALLADTNHYISFVRSSRLPNTTEINSTAAQGFGGLHVFRIATDGLQIATATTTNAPASLTATDLANIYNGSYKTWGDIPTYAGPAPTAAIAAILPQTGSGTRNDFIADIKAKTGVDLAASGVLASTVTTSEEHDPTAVAGNPNAIAPFSTGRDKLIDSGYFGTTPAPNTINLLSGPTDGTATATSPYGLARNLYLVARQNAVTSTTAFQTGGQNYVNTLFGTATSAWSRSSVAALYTAAGVTQAWADLGVSS